MPTQLWVVDHNSLFHLGVKASLSAHPHYRVVRLASLHDLKHNLLHVNKGIILIGAWSSQDYSHPTPSDLFQLLAEIQQLCRYPALLMGSANGWFIHYLIRRYACIQGYLHNADDLSACLPLALQTLEGHPQVLNKDQQMLYRHVLSVKDPTRCIYLSPSASPLVLESHQRNEHQLGLQPEDLQILREIAGGADEAIIAAKLAISRQRVYAVSRRLRRRFEASTNEDLIVRVVRSGVC